MAQWRRGSTPINIFNVNIDLREATIYITYKQNGKVIVEKTGSDLEVEEDKITTHLTQEACADRAAVADAMQKILDTMCQDKIDAKNEKIADLERQLAISQIIAGVNNPCNCNQY